MTPGTEADTAMAEFWSVLTDGDFVFVRYAFVMGACASVAFGMVGSLVVARRVTYVAGAVSHAVLAGIGAAVFMQRSYGWLWFDPLLGAALAAFVAALLLGLARFAATEREDSVIGAIWSVGVAVGLLFFAAAPGYTDPMSYLFGNILLIGVRDLWLVLVLDLVIIALTVFFYPQLKAVCFDEDFARLRGVPVRLAYTLLLLLIALTVVLLISIVGMVLVVALMTLPAAAAGRFTRSLWQMMALASVLCLIFVTTGLVFSFQADLPTGPTIILVAGVGYALALGARSALRLFAPTAQ